MPKNERRPERRLETTDVRWAADLGSNLQELSLRHEKARVARLVRDLHRLADRLDVHDRPAAALARWLARDAS